MADLDLKPDETDLVGAWVSDGSRVIADPVEQRISHLIDSLERVATDPESGGWDVLYRDPKDGRFWELTYPQSGMHGGGPKRLICLPQSVAAAKYQLAKLHP